MLKKKLKKKLLMLSLPVALVVFMLPLSACEGMLEGIDPVETVCALCDMVEETGICSIVQAKEAEECEPGERLVFVNLKDAVEKGVPLKTDCR